MDTEWPHVPGGLCGDIGDLLAQLERHDMEERRLRRADRPGRLLMEGLAPLRRLAGYSQTDVARCLGVGQGAVAHTEHRADLKLSTLQSYVAAIGARLEVVVILADEREIELELPQR